MFVHVSGMRHGKGRAYVGPGEVIQTGSPRGRTAKTKRARTSSIGSLQSISLRRAYLPLVPVGCEPKRLIERRSSSVTSSRLNRPPCTTKTLLSMTAAKGRRVNSSVKDWNTRRLYLHERAPGRIHADTHTHTHTRAHPHGNTAKGWDESLGAWHREHQQRGAGWMNAHLCRTSPSKP